MSTTKMRMGQVRHVVPDSNRVLEDTLNRYADRIEKIFTDKVPKAVAYPNPPQPSAEDRILLARASVLEYGVARVLEQWGGDIQTTEACKLFIDEALTLRRRANHQ